MCASVIKQNNVTAQIGGDTLCQCNTGQQGETRLRDHYYDGRTTVDGMLDVDPPGTAASWFGTALANAMLTDLVV